MSVYQARQMGHYPSSFNTQREAEEYAQDRANRTNKNVTVWVFSSGKKGRKVKTMRSQRKQSNPNFLSGLMGRIKEIIPAHAVVRTTDNKLHILKEKNPSRVRNVAMGFVDGSGIFHPIRASGDYSPRAAGEKVSRGRGKRKSSKRKRSTKSKSQARTVGARIRGIRASAKAKRRFSY